MMDDEKFFAWLDGELAHDKAAEMQAKVAADPELARLAEQHRALGTRLKGAFGPVVEAAMPAHLQAALRPSADVIDFGAAKRSRLVPSLPQWAAMAATLAVGVLVGTQVPRSTGASIEVQGGAIYAAAGLNQALDTE